MTEKMQYHRWLDFPLEDPALKEELLSIKDQDEEIFDRYAVQNAFADLSKLLDPALLEAFSEDLVYATPEGGDRQVAGVRLHGGSPLHRSGLYSRDIVVGITVNGENMEAALQMLKEILVQTDP